jgi:hypothetical protein
MVDQVVTPAEAQTATTPEAFAQAPKQRSFWVNFAIQNKTGTIAFGVFIAILLLAFVGPFFMPDANPSDGRNVYATPSSDHWLGTDYMAKDTWYQIVMGGRSLLLVAAAAALMSTAISVVFGALAAMIGGKFDVVVLTITDVVLTVPTIILLGVLAAFVKLNSPFLLALILAVTGWPTLLRAVRSQVLSLKEREYVEAARMLDLGTSHLLHRDQFRGRDDRRDLWAGDPVLPGTGFAGGQQLGPDDPAGLRAGRPEQPGRNVVHHVADLHDYDAPAFTGPDVAFAGRHLQPTTSRRVAGIAGDGDGVTREDMQIGG